MEIDNKILNEIEEYFGTIEEKFFYRKENIRKFAFFDLLIFIYIFCCIMLILALITSEIAVQNTFSTTILKFFNQYIFFKEVPQTKIISFSVITIPLFLCFFLLLLKRRGLTKKMNSKGLKLHLWKFCLNFYVRRELQQFLINGDESHAEKCSEYINWIEFPYSQFVPKNGSERNPFSLSDIRQQLNNKFEYLNFDVESNYIIDSLDNLESKVINRIEQNTDIEVLKKLFDYQIIFEFIKIKPEHIDSDGNTIKNNYKKYLDGFIEELNSLSKVNKNSNIINEQKENLIVKIWNKIGSFFKSKNIYTFFLSWLLLLFVICFIALQIIINYYDVKIDSTIIVAFISIPIAAAIALLNSPLKPK